MKKFKKLINLIEIDIFKTIYFNFHYLKFRDAIKFPVIIYRQSLLLDTRGRVEFNCKIRTAMIRIGKHGLGTRDVSYDRTIWQCTGNIVFNGSASIGRGSRISVEGQLILGEGFCITGASTIIAKKSVTFGKNCLVSWDVLIMDTDFHRIYDFDKVEINKPKDILIGDHVWIGCRNVILKGVSICNDTVIAANSTITKSVTEENTIVGGAGKEQQILKKKITWEQ